MTRVRRAKPEDSAAIVEFQLRLAAETEDFRLDRATVAKGVRAVFEDAAKGEYLVAEADGRVAGCVLVLPEWSDWRNGTVLWIHSLYVLPEFRRRGVFRAMYEHLRRAVQADKALQGLRLYVEKDNAAARRAYEAMGMDGEHYRMYEWMKA
jgi:ribosomal protein S18 acetylase RimI-like enzyme